MLLSKKSLFQNVAILVFTHDCVPGIKPRINQYESGCEHDYNSGDYGMDQEFQGRRYLEEEDAAPSSPAWKKQKLDESAKQPTSYSLQGLSSPEVSNEAFGLDAVAFDPDLACDTKGDSVAFLDFCLQTMADVDVAPLQRSMGSSKKEALRLLDEHYWAFKIVCNFLFPNNSFDGAIHRDLFKFLFEGAFGNDTEFYEKLSAFMEQGGRRCLLIEPCIGLFSDLEKYLGNGRTLLKDVCNEEDNIVSKITFAYEIIQGIFKGCARIFTINQQHNYSWVNNLLEYYLKDRPYYYGRSFDLEKASCVEDAFKIMNFINNPRNPISIGLMKSRVRNILIQFCTDCHECCTA